LFENRSNPLSPKFVYGIIIVNVIVFLITDLLQFSNVKVILSLIPFTISELGWLWQVFSYMFVHGDIFHIFWNMLILFMFGTILEQRIGGVRFVIFYLMTGLLVGIFSFFFLNGMGMSKVPMMGASGAIYAVLFAFAAYFPTANIYVFGIFPVKAPYLILGYAAIELLSQVSGRPSGVAHFAHLAGFVFSYLYLRIWFRVDAIKVFKIYLGGRK
jgi:membrane associated rhomboid family serine protease